MKEKDLKKAVEAAYKQLTIKQTHEAMCTHYKLLTQLENVQHAKDMAPRKKPNGFTLLEVMVAISIMSIVMWANLALFGANAKLLAVQSKKIAEAAAIIEAAEKTALYCPQFDASCTGIPKVCFTDNANGKTVQSCEGTCTYVQATGWTMGSIACIHGALFVKAPE